MRAVHLDNQAEILHGFLHFRLPQSCLAVCIWCVASLHVHSSTQNPEEKNESFKKAMQRCNILKRRSPLPLSMSLLPLPPSFFRSLRFYLNLQSSTQKQDAGKFAMHLCSKAEVLANVPSALVRASSFSWDAGSGMGLLSSTQSKK